jgi:hypothetical protein
MKINMASPQLLFPLSPKSASCSETVPVEANLFFKAKLFCSLFVLESSTELTEEAQPKGLHL